MQKNFINLLLLAALSLIIGLIIGLFRKYFLINKQSKIISAIYICVSFLLIDFLYANNKSSKQNERLTQGKKRKFEILSGHIIIILLFTDVMLNNFLDLKNKNLVAIYSQIRLEPY